MCSVNRFRTAPLLPAFGLVVLLPLGGCETIHGWAVGQLSPIKWNGETRVELPLTVNRSGTPTVVIQVMGRDVTALVDSGSTGPVISRSVASAAGLAIENNAKRANGQKRASVEEVAFQMGPVSAQAMLAVVHDAAQPAFVLGMNLFLQAVVEIDFDAGRLTLIRPDTFKPPAGKPLSTKPLHTLPTIPLQVNGAGKEICAIVDTGSSFGLSLMPDVLAHLALPLAPGGGTTVAYGAFAERAENPTLAPVNDVRIGGLQYREVVINHAPLHSKHRCENLLGMNVLARHRLVFDLRNDRIWLLPRTGNQW